MSLPPKLSLPQDQMSTLGWFLSRSSMDFARSSTAACQSGRSPGTTQEGSMRPIFCQEPWLSRFVSSITYKP